MSEKNPMICDNHLSIQMDADEIKRLANKIHETVIDDDVDAYLDEIHIVATHINSCAKDAMTQKF